MGKQYCGNPPAGILLPPYAEAAYNKNKHCQIFVSLDTLNQSSDISSVMINKIASKYFRAVFLFFLLLIFSANLTKISGQTKTNLEVFYSLTDSLISEVIKEIPEDKNKILLTLNLGESYSLFSNNIKEEFRKCGKEVFNLPAEEVNIPQVNIVMEGAGVEYGELFRDGWFGSHYVQRYSTIFGNYFLTFSNEGKTEFEITKIDTVKVEDIKYLENDSFPFTKSAIPPEPFISGLAEPLIAIGTAAIVVVLFFTIRSE